MPADIAELVARALAHNPSELGTADVVLDDLSVEGAGQGVSVLVFVNSIIQLADLYFQGPRIGNSPYCIYATCAVV